MFKRGRPALFLLAALIAGTAHAQTPPGRPGSGQVGDGPASCVAPPPDCVLYNDPRHKRCGSRGGPGCRKADGHCASWNDKVARDCRIPARAPKAAKPVAPSE